MMSPVEVMVVHHLIMPTQETRPSLLTLPTVVVMHILGYFAGPGTTGHDLNALLSLDRTCRSLHDMVGSHNMETWDEGIWVGMV